MAIRLGLYFLAVLGKWSGGARLGGNYKNEWEEHQRKSAGLQNTFTHNCREDLRKNLHATEVAALRFETEISEIITRTYNAKSIRFLRPKSFSYAAGQFMYVTISNNGQPLTKPFSISSSPTETDWLEFTKRLTEHPFSQALMASKVGDWAMIDGPYGSFKFYDQYGKIGMLTAGIGITPFRSICRYWADTESKSKIWLLYGNRTEEDIVFREELQEIESRNGNLKVVLTVDKPSQNWSGYTRKIDAEMIRKEIPDYPEVIYYVCGPPAMVESMDKLLKELNILATQIRKEDFIGY